MYKERREKYLKGVADGSISFFFSGFAPQKSNDQNFSFSVNRNFYYLTGIDQENVVLVLVRAQNLINTFIFIDPVDPVKALWDGAGLTFEQAAEKAEVDIRKIMDIATLDTFIAQVLSTSRRAVFGTLNIAYLDLERQSATSIDTKAHQFAKALVTKFPYLNIRTNQASIAQMRTIKDEFEVNQILKAADITKNGLERIMQNLKPNMTEYEIEAEYNYVLNKNHVGTSFGTIAASGKNGTTLHYVDNESKINDGDLVLFDLGVEFGHYCSDVTRTYPANKKFSKRQKEVYEVVLEANKKTIEWLKPGVTLQEFNDFGKKILIDGAKKLGLIKNDDEILKYYYHSLGHYLGLDVHDVGNYSEPIPVGAVITVEPGLYIAEEGIGIRIEDDILVTENGAINLTKDIIKEVDEIEAFMKKS